MTSFRYCSDCLFRLWYQNSFVRPVFCK